MNCNRLTRRARRTAESAETGSLGRAVQHRAPFLSIHDPKNSIFGVGIQPVSRWTLLGPPAVLCVLRVNQLTLQRQVRTRAPRTRANGTPIALPHDPTIARDLSSSERPMAKDRIYETEDGIRIAPLSALDDFEVAEGYPD